MFFSYLKHKHTQRAFYAMVVFTDLSSYFSLTFSSLSVVSCLFKENRLTCTQKPTLENRREVKICVRMPHRACTCWVWVSCHVVVFALEEICVNLTDNVSSVSILGYHSSLRICDSCVKFRHTENHLVSHHFVHWSIICSKCIRLMDTAEKMEKRENEKWQRKAAKAIDLFLAIVKWR